MKATKAQVKKMNLGQIAASVPHAAQLFYRYRLDFCCRGNQSFEEACRAKGVDENEVLSELQHLMRTNKEMHWDGMSNPDLVAHIVDAYHAELYSCVPDILSLATKVETVHGDHRECPHGLSETLRTFWRKLDSHMKMEEKILFPQLRESASASHSMPPLQEMMKDHIDQGLELQKIRGICRGYVAPEGACGTWRALYQSLEHLERNLMEHIHVENNILFERVLQAGEVPSRHG
jgi:regulator of cell morphogenesis and NO signaling